MSIASTWIKLISLSASADEAALEWARNSTNDTARHHVRTSLFSERPDKHLDSFVEHLTANPAFLQYSFKELAAYAPRAVLFRMMCLSISLGKFNRFVSGREYDVMAIAAEHIFDEAKEVFSTLLNEDSPPMYGTEFVSLARHAPAEADEIVAQLAKKRFTTLSDAPQHNGTLWMSLMDRPSVARRFADDFKKGLESDESRGCAKTMLKVSMGVEYVDRLVAEMWESCKPERQILAIQVSECSAMDHEKERLLGWLSQKPRVKITKHIRGALSRLNVPIPNVEISAAEANSRAIWYLQKERDSLRAPKRPWLDLTGLPVLRNQAGGEFDHTAAWFILAPWSRRSLERHGGVHPYVEELLEALDSQTAADFGLHVLNRWLESDQKAGDGKWVIPLTGSLGDDRVIDVLLPWIDRWFQQSNISFSRKAIWNIGRITSERSLLELSRLAKHFRGRSKQLVSLCLEAFNHAADKKSLTEDQRRDLLVQD